MGERVLNTFKRADVPLQLLRPPSLKLLYRDLFFDYFVIALSILAMHLTHYWLYPVWLLLIAGRLHALGVILHDLSHMNLKQKTFSFEILEFLCGYPIASTANAMAYHHLRHHKHTLMDDDPYFVINKKCSLPKKVWFSFTKGIFFIPFWIVRSLYGTVASVIPSMRISYAKIFLQDKAIFINKFDDELVACARREIPLAFFHITLAALAFKYDAIIYSYYFALPIAGILCIYRLLMEHEYEVNPDRNIYTLIESTFDHHFSLIDRVLIGPHGIGHHCMHHIHPNVGVHYLSKLRKWYLENCEVYKENYE